MNGKIDWQSSLSELLDEPTRESRGGFRWMHQSYVIRANFLASYDDRENFCAETWDLLRGRLNEVEPRNEALLLRVFERHARTAGRRMFRQLAERCWNAASPLARGNFLAGLSQNLRKPAVPAWIVQRITDAAFSPAAACEIGVEAIRFHIEPVLDAVLASREPLNGSVPRLEPFEAGSRFESHIKPLSDRVIDLLLEAAIRTENSWAVLRILEAGANPNLPIWCLERSYNQRYCALSYAIHGGFADISQALLDAGAYAAGIPYSGINQPLFHALLHGHDELADQLLRGGASFTTSKPSGKPAETPTSGMESEVLHPTGMFFGYFGDALPWAKRSIGSLLPLADIRAKPSFFVRNSPGGQWFTFLQAVISGDDDVERLKKYAALELDTSLSAQELCSAIDADACRCLIWLLRRKHGDDMAAKVIFRIQRRKPEFGVVRREIETLPQNDGINIAKDFEPGGQTPLELPDGSKLYVFPGAIAPPSHQLGSCLEGNIFVEQIEGIFRRRGDRVVMKKLERRWTMQPIPPNDQNRSLAALRLLSTPDQLADLLPCVKEVNGQFIWLGVVIGKLFFRIRDRGIQDALRKWSDSPAFKQALDAAWRRIQEQDRANHRPPRPQLSGEELKGYPREFWPYLLRLPDGLIGMTAEGCAETPQILEQYETWEKQNKPDSTFIPDPRLLEWEGWKDVPEEFKPFFEIDSLLDTPSVRFDAANAYEKAMIHKAVQWNNAWITPRILDEIEKADRKKDKKE